MRKKRWLPFALALVAALLATSSASADIIDFDPAQDEVPEILTEAELDLYGDLRSSQRPGISSSASPDGRYVLVSVSGRTQVLDTTTKEMAHLELGQLRFSTPLTWISPTQALALSYNQQTHEYAKTVVDFTTRTFDSTALTLPEIPGKIVRLYGAPLLQTADGVYHVVAYTQTPAQPPLRFVKPTYDSRSDEELQELGIERPQVWLLQTNEQVLAVNLDDGTATTIGTLAPGTNFYYPLSTVRSRPGTNTVAYIVAANVPWSGEVVRGRGNRGGGMPTSYWNTQEELGRIPVAENRHVNGRSLHIVDLETGAETVLQAKDFGTADDPPALFDGVVWTADGNMLLVPSDKPSVLTGRQNPVYEYVSGMVLKAFTPSGEFVADLMWHDPPMDATNTMFQPLDGTRLTAQVGVNLTRHVYIVDVGDSANLAPPVPVYTGDQMLFSWAMGGDAFVSVLGDIADPGDLYLAQADDVAGTQERLTDVNADLRTVSNIKVEPITYTTSSGYEVTGAYVYPGDWTFPPPKPMPVVVWQQGGPGGQMYNRWQTSVEGPHSLLPNFGIPLFVVNGAGRLSNGAAFYSAMADGTNFGQRDIADVKDGVQYLIDQGVADPDAVGVTGCSYGGYFTLQSMVEYPQFYSAGNAQCSLNDILYEWNFGWSPFMAYLMGDSATGNPEEFIKDSPIYRAHEIAKPLLLFHGTQDFLPYEHITNIHDQVVMNGVPARFFRAHGYGHGIGGHQDDRGGVNGQRYAFQLQVQWFREHLGATGTLSVPALHQRFDLLPRLPIEGVRYQ